MKKNMTFGELKEYFRKNPPRKITYYTENQDWYRVEDPCKIQMTFPSLLVSENPNLICLKSGNGTLLFDRVKTAEVDTTATVLGTVVTLYCSDSDTGQRGISFKLIVI